MAYAQGKYANAICDRCGMQYPFTTLRKEWTGYKVCIECYEPKHPQLETKRNVSDSIALRDPRPDGPSVMTVYVQAPGDTYFSANGMMPVPMSQDIVGQGSVGSVQVVIT